MGELVVGVDGSDGSRVALAWAVEEARLPGDDLTIVTVIAPPGLLFTPTAIGEDLQRRADVEAKHRAEALLEEMIAPHADAGVAITPVAVRDDATFDALVRRAADAEALIVGSRGLGALRWMLLGSVSSQVAVHADTTIVVVPEPSDEQQRDDKVIFGVDGSGHARVALRRAAIEARMRAWELELLTIQPPPPVASPPDPVATWSRPTCGLVRWCRSPCRTRTRWQTTTSGPRGTGATWPRECSRRSSTESAPRCCPTRSRRRRSVQITLPARCSTSRHGAGGMLLGSISQHCVRHATAPVMIVPPDDA